MREAKAATSLAETEGEGGDWEMGGLKAPSGEGGIRDGREGGQGIKSRAILYVP